MLTTKQIHTQLITALVKTYKDKGYYVKADHINHPNGAPASINGHIPDIAAYSQGQLIIVAEAETCDTIGGTETYNQWSAFSRGRHKFHVIVPQACLADAQNQAAIWQITVDQWWWLKV